MPLMFLNFKHKKTAVLIFLSILRLGSNQVRRLCRRLAIPRRLKYIRIV
ncbi:hypothetical protein NM2004085_2160 [Neisseria meningitidis 2004085]|nr:hypothetical protein NM2004085_2160 [Neisseria meningitidis 2004085]